MIVFWALPLLASAALARLPHREYHPSFSSHFWINHPTHFLFLCQPNPSLLKRSSPQHTHTDLSLSLSLSLSPVAMSEEEELIATGSYSSFFWENNIVEPWMMNLDSYISGGGGGGGGDDKINGKKPLIDSSSNSPTTPYPTPVLTPPPAGSSNSPTPYPTPTMTPPMAGSSNSPTPYPTPTMTPPLAGSSISPTPNPTPTVTPPLRPVSKKRGRHGGLPRGGGKSIVVGSAAAATTTTTPPAINGVGESDHEIHIWTERERRTKMRNMFSGLHALLPQLPPKADKTTIVDEAINYIQDLQQSLKKLHKQKLDMLRGGGGGGGTAPTASVDYDQQQPLAIVASSTISGFNSREAFLADQAAATGSAPPTTTTTTTSTINNAMMMITNNNNMNNPSSSSSTPQCSFSMIPGVPCNINPLAAASLQTWCSPNVVLCVNGKDAQISVSAPKKIGLFSTVCNVLEKHKLEVVSAHISADLYRSMFMIHAHATGAAFEQFPGPLSLEELYKFAVEEIIFWLSC